MKRFQRMLAVTALWLASASGCVDYLGVSRVGKTVYLTGQTHFLIFSSAWVKRCFEVENQLQCAELTVKDLPSGPRAPAPGPSRVTAPAPPALERPLGPRTSRGRVCYSVDEGPDCDH